MVFIEDPLKRSLELHNQPLYFYVGQPEGIEPIRPHADYEILGKRSRRNQSAHLGGLIEIGGAQFKAEGVDIEAVAGMVQYLVCGSPGVERSTYFDVSPRAPPAKPQRRFSLDRPSC